MSNTTDIKYLLDANVFIQAHRSYYAFDICPGFWDLLIKYSEENTVHSIDWVRNELKTGDELNDWIKSNAPDNTFLKSDDVDTVTAYSQLMAWVQLNPQFNTPAKAEFANIADGWLVAFCMAHGYKLVTQEIYNEFTKKKVPIPNLCKEFSVECIDTYQFLRDLEASFHLK